MTRGIAAVLRVTHRCLSLGGRPAATRSLRRAMRGFVIGRSQISRLLADSWLAGLPDISIKCPIRVASSTGRCNTIWYKAVFKGGVYEPRETVWTFCREEARHVVALEGGTVAS